MNGRVTHGVLVACLAAAVLSVAWTSAQVPAAAAKHCKVVTKKVHGKKRRVRVCTHAPPPMPSAGTVAARIQVGTPLIAVAASDDAVWVLTNDRRLVRIDPTTNRIVATIALPDSEWPEATVALGDGAVWVTVASPSTTTNPELDSLLRIDPATNTIAARIHVGHSPEGIAVTPGAIWTANHRSSWPDDNPHPNGIFEISRVDPVTNTETRRVQVEKRSNAIDDHAGFCCGPQGMTAAAGSIWITDPQDSGSGLVIRVDPVTGAVVTLPVADPKLIACGEIVGDSSAVWFFSSCDVSTVGRIDPASNRIVKRIDVGNAAFGIALGLGSVWVAENGPFGPSGLDRIDPATNKVVARTKIESAGAVAVGAGSVWVTNAAEVVRVSPK